MNEEMKQFNNRVQAIKELYPNAKIFRGNLAFTEDETEITLDETAISNKVSEIETAQANEVQNKEDLKASAKTKLMNGEALTEDEANVMVGL